MSKIDLDAIEKQGTTWDDPLFLRDNKLNESNVMYYFSLSTFFDKNSINNKLKNITGISAENIKYFFSIFFLEL